MEINEYYIDAPQCFVNISGCFLEVKCWHFEYSHLQGKAKMSSLLNVGVCRADNSPEKKCKFFRNALYLT